jgi:hypothetical protein
MKKLTGPEWMKTDEAMGIRTLSDASLLTIAESLANKNPTQVSSIKFTKIYNSNIGKYSEKEIRDAARLVIWNVGYKNYLNKQDEVSN